MKMRLNLFRRSDVFYIEEAATNSKSVCEATPTRRDIVILAPIMPYLIHFALCHQSYESRIENSILSDGCHSGHTFCVW
jgi:hypothetical protein